MSATNRVARTGEPTQRSDALSRACHEADWDDPEIARLIHEIVPPAVGKPARKAWEFAVGVRALEAGGALREDARGISVAAGHEAVVYYLTNRCAGVVAADLYGGTDFAVSAADHAMLHDPDLFAPYPYRRRRLTVVNMDALDLRFEDETFDYAVSFSSIEHFGGRAQAARGLAEMARVVRPGGVLAIATEMVIDGGEALSGRGLELFTPGDLHALVAETPAVDWLGGVDLTPPSGTAPLVLAPSFDVTGWSPVPHLALTAPGAGGEVRQFTSALLALVRT
jgi:SAM-dependent methyltransferase